MTPSDTPRRGRPPGEVTPESMIRQELMAHLKLYRKTREMIEVRLDTATLDADELAKYMDLLRKGISDLSKPIVPQAKAENAKPAEAEEDAALILERLMGGNG